MNLILVAFLGNPGKEYERTRHNYAWMLADKLGEGLTWQQKFKAEIASWALNDLKAWFLKPQTFMNLSGDSVGAALGFYKLETSQLLVVHDDLELPLGEYKFQRGGGLGGHNGLRSLEKHLGTRDFYRFRLGIGRPLKGDVSAHVLGRFRPEEEITLNQTLIKISHEWKILLEKI